MMKRKCCFYPKFAEERCKRNLRSEDVQLCTFSGLKQRHTIGRKLPYNSFLGLDSTVRFLEHGKESQGALDAFYTVELKSQQ